MLALLYGRPDESFYTRQIARAVATSVGAVQRELETLVRIGLLHRTKVGNLVFYRADRDNPIFSELRSIVSKTVGVFGILAAALAPWSRQIAVAFVYGSMARSEETARSDVDLVVIGTVKLETLLSALGKAEMILGRAVDVTLYSRPEFASKTAARNHFVNAIVNRQKVFLIGTEDDLRELGGERLARARAHQPRKNKQPSVRT